MSAASPANESPYDGNMMCYACHPGESIRIFVCLFYGFSISEEGVSNFSGKYFVLVLCWLCFKQFHLFQHYTSWARSLIMALNKEPHSGISDNGANREAVSTSEDLQEFSAAVSEHWTGRKYLSLDQLRGKLEHLCRTQQGNCYVVSQHCQRHCPREALALVLQSCY